MDNEKVLTIVPEYPNTPYVWPATVESLDDTGIAWQRLPTPPHTDGCHYTDLCHKHNDARQLALDMGMDALLLIEADMIVPPDVLDLLLSVPGDIIYGLYCCRSRPKMWLMFPEIKERWGASICRYPSKAKLLFGTVSPSEGAGLGCTLIRRKALEEIPFRWDGGDFADDWLFANDAKEASLTQMHHLGVVCGHLDHEGGILWPDPTQPKLFRRDTL